MDLQLTALSLLVGYLMGSVSFARVVSRLAAPGSRVPEVTDLHLEGSDQVFHLGTVSASSVSARHGSKLGFLVFLLDLAKVAVPVLLFRLWLPSGPYFLVVATAAVAGHIWPVYHRFRGGRGLSAIYGTLLVVDWIGMLIAGVGGMVVGLFVLRSVLLAYVLGPWLVVPWLWWRTGDPAHVAFAVAAAIMFTVSMIPEIRQWRRISKEEKWDDYQTVMQLSGMGRGILKVAKKIGVVK
jgi:acyl phosphate:glycerol-3-phosphate acyltransferase